MKAIISSIMVIFLIIISSEVLDNVKPPQFAQRCSPVPISYQPCQQFYNYTTFPNLAGQESHELAIDELETFNNLVRTKCHKQLQFLLCSVYLPVCDSSSKLFIGPCQDICYSVKDSCEHYLIQVGLLWPKSLDCKKLPISFNVSQQFCMNAPIEFPTDQTKEMEYQEKPNSMVNNVLSMLTFDHRPCRHLKGVFDKKSLFYYNKTHSCSLKCSKVNENTGLYSGEQKEIIEVILKIFLAFSITICSLGLLSSIFIAKLDKNSHLIIGPNSIQKHKINSNNEPEAWWNILGLGYNTRLQSQLIYALGWICSCQLLQTIPIILRLLIGYTKSICDLRNIIILKEGSNNPVCAMSFLIDNFFFNATLSWAFVFALTYFVQLKSCRKFDTDKNPLCNAQMILVNYLQRSMSTERSANSGQVWRHVLAWIPAALMTATVLVMRDIEANELTGICQIGLHKNHNLWLSIENRASSDYSDLRHLILYTLNICPIFLILLLITLLLVGSSKIAKSDSKTFGETSISSRMNSNFLISERSNKNMDQIGVKSLKTSLYIWASYILLIVIFIQSTYEYFSWPNWMLKESSTVNWEPFIVQLIGVILRHGFVAIICLHLLRKQTLIFFAKYIKLYFAKCQEEKFKQFIINEKLIDYQNSDNRYIINPSINSSKVGVLLENSNSLNTEKTRDNEAYFDKSASEYSIIQSNCRQNKF